MSRFQVPAIVFASIIAMPQTVHAERRYSELVRAEQETLAKMNEAMTRYEQAIQVLDETFAAMRNHFERKRYSNAEDLAPQAQDQITRARRSWAVIERLYKRAVSNEYKLNRLSHVDYLNANPSLQIYLAMKINNRFDHGSPLSLLIKTWRGLALGKKHEEMPQTLKLSDSITKLELKQSDSVLLFLTNGGLIRGAIEGWTRNGDLILREVMPIGFVRFQKQLGHYRRILPEEWHMISAVEVYRRRYTPSSGLPPLPILDREGNYGPSVTADVFERPERLYLRPSDEELLRAARTKSLETLRHLPEIQTFKYGEKKRPTYPGVLLFSCEGDLS